MAITLGDLVAPTVGVKEVCGPRSFVHKVSPTPGLATAVVSPRAARGG
ncbi:MAG: hypothetical protein P4L20_08340 [Acidimicrobiales bacterium]|nr:hypothetical protein [Acidimicrobiales bacterium]